MIQYPSIGCLIVRAQTVPPPFVNAASCLRSHESHVRPTRRDDADVSSVDRDITLGSDLVSQSVIGWHGAARTTKG